MLFNSFSFLVFFPVVVLVLFIIPRRFRSVWLLIASYWFYMSWNPKYAVLIGLSTVITYFSGIMIEKADTDRGRKAVVAFSLISNLGILALFKYANFVLDTVSAVCGRFGVSTGGMHLDLLLPVGISFYTFQALGYTLDVYRGTISSEKNIINYALFVSFFPQLVAGPIERSGNLLRQIRSIKELQLYEYARVRDGLLLMLWGYFQKLVIADRASILVHRVFDHYRDYGLAELCVASVLFAFQIYCDFSGYTDIARGAARVMGFSLTDNFLQPYFAVNIKDFWRRWHRSLTSWFTDYLYIPLGGSRKGLARYYINIIIVFAVSGLWHGASWHFVAWGLIHAGYRIAGDVKKRLAGKLRNGEPRISFIRRLGKCVITFALVDFTWIFFASDSIHMALGILRRMGTEIRTTGLFRLGLDRTDWIVLIAALVILFLVDLLHEKGLVIAALVEKQVFPVRGLIWLCLVWGIILLGIYGAGYDTSQFIYFQF